LFLSDTAGTGVLVIILEVFDSIAQSDKSAKLLPSFTITSGYDSFSSSIIELK